MTNNKLVYELTYDVIGYLENFRNRVKSIINNGINDGSNLEYDQRERIFNLFDSYKKISKHTNEFIHKLINDAEEIDTIHEELYKEFYMPKQNFIK